MNSSLLQFLFFGFVTICPVLSLYVIDDFETHGVDNWDGLTLSSDIKHSGQHSGCWLNTSRPGTITLDVTKIKTDWSSYSLFSMWVYSPKADGGGHRLVVYSENPSTSNIDYYAFNFNVDWTGWKEFRKIIPSGFSKGGSPLGWDQVTSFIVYSRERVPGGSSLCFDDISLSSLPPSFAEEVNMTGALVPGFETRFYVPMKGLESGNKQSTLDVTISKGSEYVKSAVWEDTSRSITEGRTFTAKSNEFIFYTVKVTGIDDMSSGKGKDLQIDFCLSVTGQPDEEKHYWSFVGKINPDPATVLKSHPYMLLSKTEVSKLKQERSKKTWVNDQLKLMEDYGNSVRMDWDFFFPQGVSADSSYYVCNDGTSLVFDISSPKSHYCPTDKRYYTGEPYDSAWIAVKHSRNINYAYELAQSYLLNKNDGVFKKIKGFLLDYAKNYQTIPIHGNAKQMYFYTSGARITSQTLDESIFDVDIAITYDIIYEDLSREERSYIEYNLLRPLYGILQRYNAKKANWQSWNNVGMTCLGVVLNDKSMVEHAIEDETGGFKFQIGASIGDDGIWYEQSMGYHYFALNALTKTAEFAKSMGYDLYHYTVPMNTIPGRKKGLKDMYMGPLHLMMPNKAVPALNDGNEVSLASSVEYYEVAFDEYPEEETLFGWALCTLLANATRRSFYALKHGKQLPDWCTLKGPSNDVKNPLTSEYLDTSGTAIMRRDGDYLLYENGPHGGTHGHYDKLGIVFYSHGVELIKDYGSVAYHFPVQDEYFKRTLSHSAPMLDGVCQAQSNATGTGFVDGSMGTVQMSKVTTYPLNGGNKLRRTLFLISDEGENNEYPLVLDINEAIIENKSQVSQHFFDVMTHSETNYYSLFDSEGRDVSVSSTSQKMGDDVAWTYLTSMKKTESKQAMTGIFDWGHSVRHQFDKASEWTGLELSKDHYLTGQYSLRWKNHVSTLSTSTKKFMTDWSDVELINITMYNVVPNTEKLYLIVRSENSTTSQADYYRYIMPLDWTGWKTFSISKKDFVVGGYPLGWDCITGLVFSAVWGSTQCESSDLYLDSMFFFRRDGSEIDSSIGLEQHLPQVGYDRTTFFDLNAPSNPISTSHAVSIIRQNANEPVVQVLRPYTETDFVSSFTQSASSFVIKTKTETITVEPGDLNSGFSCSSVKRQSTKKGTVTTQLGCRSIKLTHSDPSVIVELYSREDSTISLQTGSTPPGYDAKTRTVTFKDVKLPGTKKIGINVTSCSDAKSFAVSVNGKTADAVAKTSKDKNGCITQGFSINLNENPSHTGSLTVVLKETSDVYSFSGAGITCCSITMLLITLSLYLLV